MKKSEREIRSAVISVPVQGVIPARFLPSGVQLSTPVGPVVCHRTYRRRRAVWQCSARGVLLCDSDSAEGVLRLLDAYIKANAKEGE